jgi:hypothetical protein
VSGLKRRQLETVRAAGAAAMLDPDGFATALGRRLHWERMRGRGEGLGLALVAVVVFTWLWGLEPEPLVWVLGGATVLAYVIAGFIGKRPR